MIVNSISAAKAQLSALIARVREGEDVIIGKAGKPVAVLTRYTSTVIARRPGALKGRIRMAADFDALPEDLAVAFGMVAEEHDDYHISGNGPKS